MDSLGAVDTITVNVTVTSENDLPVITEGASISRTISEDGIPTSFSLTLNATDADSDPLEWSVLTPALHGTAGASGIGASKSISYAPSANYHGPDSFVVQVEDGVGGEDTITINITINSVNDAPVFDDASPVSVAMSTNGAPVPFSLTLDASDLDGDTIAWSISSAAAHGTANVTGTGESKAIEYAPEAEYSGADSFVVQIADGNGGTATITVNVTITTMIKFISGTVGLAGVNISYTGSDNPVPVDENGDYSIEIPYNWSGTVTPVLEDYSFEPPSRDYTLVQADKANEDYEAWSPAYLSRIPERRPNFDWPSEESAVDYQLQVSTSSNFPTTLA